MKKYLKIKYLCVVVLVILLYSFVIYNIVNYKEGRLSEEENRVLRSIPTFNVEDIKSGSYGKEIESFLTDNIQHRSDLISIVKKIKYFYSINNYIKDDTIIFVNNNININDDADIDMDIDIATYSNIISTESEIKIISTISEINNISTESEIDYVSDVLNQIQNDENVNYIIYKGEAYSASKLSAPSRNYSKSVIDKLYNQIKSDTFSLIASPTKSVLIRDEKVLEALGDQASDIKKFYKSLRPEINTVNITDTILSHGDEYIYFNSDHHWTQLGAYYAYREFMKSIGRTPAELDELNEDVANEHWKGIAYPVTKNERLKDIYDTVTNYYSKKPCTMFTLSYNMATSFAYTTIINKAAGYSAYLGEKGVLKIIDVPSNDPSNTLLILGDSYADAIVPILVENYSKIIYIDARRSNEYVYKTALRLGVDLDNIKDVLICCNFDSFNNHYIPNKIEKAFGVDIHNVYRTKKEYFTEFYKDFYKYLIKFQDIVNLFVEKGINDEYIFINNLLNMEDETDYIRNEELIKNISRYLVLDNFQDNLFDRESEYSFVGWCLKNAYHLRLLNNIKTELNNPFDAMNTLIKLCKDDNIEFNMVK